MEVTLRKAAQLEKKLLETARGLPLVTTVNVSIYATNAVSAEVEASSKKLSDNLTKALSLIAAAYAIRGAIGQANATHGVDTLLTEDALLSASEKLITPVVGTAKVNLYDETPSSNNVDEAARRLEALKVRVASATDRYGSSQDSVSVSVLGNEVVAEFQDRLARLRRRKATITEELLTINMTKKVTLSAEAVALLEEFKLV